MMNPESTVLNNPQPCEHSEPKLIFVGKAELFISEKFTKNFLAICNQGIFNADSDAMNWLTSTVRNIKDGNYDAILPENLNEIPHGAVLVYDDNDNPQWVIIDDEDINIPTDDERRNYAIHIYLPKFVQVLTDALTTPIRPSELGFVTASNMLAAQGVINDLRALLAHNANPDIPFEDKLNGNSILFTEALSPESQAALRVILFGVGYDSTTVNEFSKLSQPHTYGPWLPDDTCRPRTHVCTDAAETGASIDQYGNAIL